MNLTIFYDGSCPLCMAEMRELEKLDTGNRLQLEDIFQSDFQERFPHIDREKAMAILHGQLANGAMLYGLDVTVSAWQLVGQKKWLVMLRWPLIKNIADRVYLFFAKYRGDISKLFTGAAYCEPCSLQRRHSNLSNKNGDDATR